MTHSGDVLIVEEEEEPKPKKELEVKEESDSDSEGSLSTDSDSSLVEDHGENHNLTTVKPLKNESTSVSIENEEKKPEPRRKKKLTRSERAKSFNENRKKLLLGLVKPDIAADRERERKLIHIATKGVVQLFNKVAERQAEIKKEENAAMKKNSKGKPIVKKESDGHTAPPPLSHLLNIRVPMGPPSKKVKQESEVVDVDTDTDGGVIVSEAEVKTEPESD